MKWLRLIISIVICLSAGFIGSIFTTSSITNWYQTLNKPVFNPPNWIFGPVWTILFILMGISLFLVWQKGLAKNKISIFIFCAQFILNIAWSFLFFYLHNPLAAFIEIIILWVFILITIVYFYKVDKYAAYLLIPYILWVSFASILNFYIYLLN